MRTRGLSTVYICVYILVRERVILESGCSFSLWKIVFGEDKCLLLLSCTIFFFFFFQWQIYKKDVQDNDTKHVSLRKVN